MNLYIRNHGFSKVLAGIGCVFLVSVVLCPPGLTQVSVLTHHNDNARTGQNLSEPYLTPTVVNTAHFGELFTQPVDGFVIAEPLYMPNLKINGATHNVMFVVTLHDGVYAFDADNQTGSNASPLWYTSFINPPSVTTVPIADQGCPLNGYTEMGILGTPVIDLTTNTMYVVAKTLENGNYVFRLHALDILTGQEALGGPVVIQASYISKEGERVTFTAQHRMQRPALLLSNGVVYVAFGTMGCKAYPPSTGWVLAYSAMNLEQLGVLDVAPERPAVPGIWMGGDGPATDSSGDVYLTTGDGIFDYDVGGFDYGDTLMKLSLGGGNFGLVDYFTPYNQADLNTRDLDLGSSGPVLLPDQAGPNPHLAVIAGKQGMIYLVNRDGMGEYNPVVDQVLQEVPFDPNTEIEIVGGATYWNGFVYFSGRNSPIRAFSLSGGLLSTSPVSTTQNYHFSSLFSISANGQQNGILWGVQQQNFASQLVAFNATTLKPLYASASPRDPIQGSTYLTLPMVANGKVYVGTKVNVTVMGLFGSINNIGGGNQTGGVGTRLPKGLRVRVTDAYTGNVIPGVTISFTDGGSGGSFSNPSSVTDSKGIAATSYTLPAQAGTYTVTASSAKFTPAHFNETATQNAQSIK